MFPKFKTSPSKIFVFGGEALGAWILEGLGIESFKGPIEESEVVLVTDSRAYLDAPQKVDAVVRGGAMAVLLSLPVGEHVIGSQAIGSQAIGVRQAGMGPRHFVSCDSGNPLVAGFQREDFKFWFYENLGHASPILSTVLEAGVVRGAPFPLPLNTPRGMVAGAFAKSKYTIGSAPILWRHCLPRGFWAGSFDSRSNFARFVQAYRWKSVACREELISSLRRFVSDKNGDAYGKRTRIEFVYLWAIKWAVGFS